jgi:hypothetical protein
MKIYDGSSWQEAKGLRFFNGGSWTPAVKGWVFTGSGWIQHYPNFPQYTQGPIISGNNNVGATISVSAGLWTQDIAYAPTSYSYQWKRNGSNISGATGSNYTTTSSDSGQTLTATVTAINQRGTSLSNSINSILIVPASLTGLSLTDSTSTPAVPSTVSVTGGTNAWSASWTNTGAPSYGVRTNNGYVSYSGGTSATGYSATAGSATVYVKSINTNGLVSVSWSPSAGASYYNVSWTGGNSATIYTTSTTISWPVGNNLGVIVTPMSSNGYGGGNQSSSITPAQKESGENSGVGTIVDPVYAPSYINYTENGFGGSYFVIPNDTSRYVTTGTTLSVTGVSAPGATAPVTYSYAWETDAGSGFNVNGSTGSSYTISTGQGPGGTAVRCKITASNSAGSTFTYTSSTGGIVNPSGTLQAPTGISMGNDVSPAGGSLYYTDPTFTVGVGSSYSNWNHGPRWGSNIQWYRSTTSGGTYTANGSFLTRAASTSQQVLTRSSAGWYYVIIEGYKGDGSAGTTTRFPSSGGFQFT